MSEILIHKKQLKFFVRRTKDLEIKKMYIFGVTLFKSVPHSLNYILTNA